MAESAPPFDAVLLLSFGGPEGPQDVMPFLENVTRGRGIPRERLELVAQHYMLFGGVSPINEECRKLIAELRVQMQAGGPPLPIYWGNRNWAPLLTHTVAQMARDGVRRAVALVTSAFSSYSACRQYLEDIERARAAVGESAPIIEKLPPYWNHPAFLETMAENTRVAVDALPRPLSPRMRLVFTAHSIPLSMVATCDYEAELKEAAALVAQQAAPDTPWDLVYQSRSGPPGQPWLEPDVCDHLRALAADGVDQVVLVPIGFVADHMEVKYDLDVEAADVARASGITVRRAACVGAAPSFVAGLVDLVRAHVEGRPATAVGSRGARPFPCAPGCCAYVPRRPASSGGREA